MANSEPIVDPPKSLEQENAELKEDLQYFIQQRKVGHIIWTVILAFIVYAASQFLVYYASIGVSAVAAETHLSYTAATLLGLGVNMADFIIWITIMAAVLVDILQTFRDELEVAVKKFIVFIRAGRDAVNGEEGQESVPAPIPVEKTKKESTGTRNFQKEPETKEPQTTISAK